MPIHRDILWEAIFTNGQNLVLDSHVVPFFFLSLLLQDTSVSASDRSYAGRIGVSPLASFLTAISEEQ
jgi:hypothetical protein